CQLSPDRFRGYNQQSSGESFGTHAATLNDEILMVVYTVSRMELPPFELERWLDKYESDADLMLAESGVRSLPADRFDLDVDELGYVIPTDGTPEFRTEIAERYDRDTEEVVLTCGTQEADFLTFMSL